MNDRVSLKESIEERKAREKIARHERYLREKETHKEIWRAQNKANFKNRYECCKRYRAKNPDSGKKYWQRYEERNPGARAAYMREWRKNNPEAKRASEAKRRAAMDAGGGHYTKDDVRNLVILQKNRCATCHSAFIGVKFHVDHIMPLALGGTNDKLNIQLLCKPCNMEKRALHPIDFMQRKGYLL